MPLYSPPQDGIYAVDCAGCVTVQQLRQRVAPPAAGARPPRAPGAGGRALQARAFSRRLRGGLGLSGGCEGGAVPAQPEVLVPGWALGRGARAREDASE